MRILVTGGAGFIGSATVRLLLAAGHEVTVYDNFETGDRAGVPAGVRLIEADIRDRAAIATACQGHDAVIHLAAMVSVALSVSEPELCREINMVGTRHVLDAARRGGASRVVLASTAAVYGNNPRLPKREDLLLEPESPYAYAKWVNEVDARFDAEYLGMEAVCLRFFNVYGPRQRPDSPYSGVISIAANRILQGQTFTINGDGLQTRDFVYVDDVAASVVAAATRPGIRFEILNVGNGERVTLLELLQALEAATGRKATIVHGPARVGDVRHSVAYISRLRKVLGIKPVVPLEPGLRATVAWMRGEPER